MLYIILQIIAFQALFLLVYDLFLRNETFFNLNRGYLLITSAVALVLPFFKLPELQKITSKDVVIQLPEVFIGSVPPTEYEIEVAQQAGILIEQPQTPIWQTVILVGIALAALLFTVKISRLYWLKHNNPKRWYDSVLVVKLLKSTAAFSFFNTIFLGEHIPETEKGTIYKHELVHVKQRHTLDLLFFEVLRIVFWFNPLVYICQNRIKELHEFIADAKAVKENGKKEYYQSLLNQVFDVQNISFTNTFFKTSLIKKRIAMLQKSKSRQLNLLKYALLIPLVFGMLIYTSTEVKAQKKIEEAQDVVQEMTDEELIEKYYKEILKMKDEGKSFIEIYKYFGFPNKNSKYIVSREKFLKRNAFLRYLSDVSSQRISEMGALTDKDSELTENMRTIGHRTYEDYREWKKTEEAKNIWEDNADYDELRLVVNELGAMTKEEQRHLDSLLKQVEKNDNITKLIVCDTKGASKLELSEPRKIKSTSTKVIEAEYDVEVPFSVIENVPTTIECKDLATNLERKQCMSDFVSSYVNKNFNISVADTLGLKGRQRIFVAFKIDKNGNVFYVRARAAHPVLEEEAERVVNSLPQFVPGKQKGKEVVVPYSLPIVFQIAGSENESKTPIYNKFKDSITIKKEKVPYSVVEVAPTHPDCITFEDNDKRKKCTSDLVLKVVNGNFNKALASTLDLPSGQHQIFGAFTIDNSGFVRDAKARAKHEKLEEEFVRVIKLLPQFIPGEEKGEKVNVAYSVPIVFQLENKKKND